MFWHQYTLGVEYQPFLQVFMVHL